MVIEVYNLPGNFVREEKGFDEHSISLEGIAGNVFIVIKLYFHYCFSSTFRADLLSIFLEFVCFWG